MLDDNSHEAPPRYHLSGAMGRMPAVVMFLAIASGVILGLLAGAISVSVNSERLVFALPFFLGPAIGYGCFWLSQQLNSRNSTFVQAAALMGGLAAAYALVVAFVSSVTLLGPTPFTPPPVANLFLNPILLINTFSTIVASGVIYIGRNSIAGTEYEFRCILQIATFVIAPIVTARIYILRQVFCEDCRKWLDVSRKRLLFPAPEDRGDLSRLRGGELTALLEQDLHRPIHASRPPYIRLDYVLCEKCGNTGVFRLMSVTPRATRWFGSHANWSNLWGTEDGKTIEETALTPLMQLTPDAAHQLGLLQARDRESKGANTKPIAIAIKPSVRKPLKPMKPLSTKKRGDASK